MFFIQFFELFFSTYPAVFLLHLTDFCFVFPDFLELTFSMTSVTSTDLLLKFVFVTSFLLLGQFHDLPHSKNDF